MPVGARDSGAARPLPRLEVRGAWGEVFRGAAGAGLEAALPAWVVGRRWFGGKARGIARVALVDAAPIDRPEGPWLVLAEVHPDSGPPDRYVLALAFSPGGPRSDGLEVALLRAGSVDGVIHGAERDPGVAHLLLGAMGCGARQAGAAGALEGSCTRAFEALAAGTASLPAALMRAEQSNTSFRIGERVIVKVFRRTEAGPNPDLEIGAFLTEADFRHASPVLGGLLYRPAEGAPLAVAIAQAFVPNRGDAWSAALAAATTFLDRAAPPGTRTSPPEPPPHPADAAAELPPAGHDGPGDFLAEAALLGRRTGELHLALASRADLPDFSPAPFSAEARRATLEEAAALLRGALAMLHARRGALPPAAVPWADRVLAGDGALAARLERLAARPLDSRLIRTHGDYHLGQVLWTGTDFVIIDFEGEPARPLALRREKRPALRDVAGMLRSFQYAGSQAVADRLVRAPAAPPEDEVLHAWGRAWTRWAQGAFLRAWLEVASADQALGGPPEETRDLLDLFLVEKACYELAYELNNRPDWVGLPLAGLAELAGPGRTTT